MDLKDALKEQLHAGLEMLADCVQKCPEYLWVEGQHPRTFWRIAFHAAFFTHLYLGQTEESFAPWPNRKEGNHYDLWENPAEVEPSELPEKTDSYSRKEISDYIQFVDSLIDMTVNELDLETSESGFSWYPNINKLSHELLNLRHLQGHIGQLSEILMARGIDIDWVSMG